MEQEEFEIKMEQIAQEKKEILDSIFITQHKAKQIRNYNKKIKEVDLMIKCAELSTKLDKIVEVLGDILRESDPKGENKILQDIFIQFYIQIDEFESKEHLEKLRDVLFKQHKTLI